VHTIQKVLRLIYIFVQYTNEKTYLQIYEMQCFFSGL